MDKKNKRQKKQKKQPKETPTRALTSEKKVISTNIDLKVVSATFLLVCF